MSRSRNVLCVLLEDHRKEYEPEFARLRQTGANFVFESNPEKSLSMVGEIDPNLVIVGMDVGSMEGIEFLALLTSQYPGFNGSVVVLPEKADGMPPVIHSRAQSDGRSAVEGVDFDHIAALIAGPQPRVPATPPPPAPAPAVPAPAVPAPAVPAPAVPAPAVPAPSASPAMEAVPDGMREPALAPAYERPRKARWPIPLAAASVSTIKFFGSLFAGKARRPVTLAAACGVLVLVIAGYLVFSGDDEAKQNPEGASDTRTASAVLETGPAVELAKEPAKEPAEEPDDREKELVATADPPVAPPDPPIEPPVEEHPDLPEKFVLPLAFEQGVGRPEISDRDKLDSIVDALKSQPALKIELTGHTSAPGEVSNNFKLGMLRARMAKKLLVRRGISPRRVKLRSRGEKEPSDSSPTGGSNPSNRRVEARLIH